MFKNWNCHYWPPRPEGRGLSFALSQRIKGMSGHTRWLNTDHQGGAGQVPHGATPLL
jgi:hypothetical protein